MQREPVSFSASQYISPLSAEHSILIVLIVGRNALMRK